MTLPPGTGGGCRFSQLVRSATGPLYGIVGEARVVQLAAGSSTWTSCGPIANANLQRITLDPISGAVWVSGYPDVWTSSDGCASWTATGFDSYAVGIGFLNGVVYAGASDGLYAYSAGAWNEVATPASGSAVSEIAIDAPFGHIFAGTQDGFIRSFDSGATWQTETTGLPGGGIAFVTIDPDDTTRLAASADTLAQSLYVSTDTGSTWTQTANGGFAIAFDPRDPTFAVYASYDDGDVSSSDGAMTFTTADTRTTAMEQSPTLALAFDGDGGVFAGTGRGIFYAADHSLAWSELDDGLAAWSIANIAITSDGTWYLATAAGVLSSSDRGATWSEGDIAAVTDSDLSGIVATTGTSPSLFAASANDIVRSDDGGQTYSIAYTATDTDLYQVFALRLAGNELIAGTGGGVVTSVAPFTTFTFHEVAGADRYIVALLALDATGTKIVAGGDQRAVLLDQQRRDVHRDRYRSVDRRHLRDRRVAERRARRRRYPATASFVATAPGATFMTGSSWAATRSTR